MMTAKDSITAFQGFCTAKYGAGVRKTACLAAVWRASVIEGRAGQDVAKRVCRLLRRFDDMCAKEGIEFGRGLPMKWEVAAVYFGGLKK